jgi:hypothetical protein
LANDTITLWNGVELKYYDNETQRYKLWIGRHSTRVWSDMDYLNDWCGGDRNLFTNLMILMTNADIDNVIVRKHGRKHLPVCNEEQLRELLGIKRSSWFKVKKFITKKKILIFAELKLGDETYYRYYINPLLTLGSKGLSLSCYKLFREYLLPHITDNARDNLDRHLSEEYSTPLNKMI